MPSGVNPQRREALVLHPIRVKAAVECYHPANATFAPACMNVTLLVTCPPESPVAAKALDFARALLRQGHAINRLFFFAEGVKNALPSAPLAAQWQTLMTQAQLDVTVCSGSAARHGVDADHTLLPIAGLGDWLMATLASDRLVTF